MKRKKILLTGASGFIGKNIIDILQKKNFIIYCFVRKQKKNTKKIKYIKHDLLNYIKFDKTCDVIIHCSAKSPEKDKFNYTDYRNNILITKNLIEYSKKNKKIDSCFASFYQKKNFWIKKNKKLIRISPNKNKIKPRQLKSGVYREDTGVALATRAKFLRRGQRLGKNLSCIPYTNPIYSIDINTNDDLITARKLAKK